MAHERATPNPQRAIDNFWRSHLSAAPTQVLSVLPRGIYSQLVDEERAGKDVARGRPVAQSYQLAVEECEGKISQIVAECRRTNTKYTDPNFDLDNMYDCLVALTARASSDTTSNVSGHTVSRDHPETSPTGKPSESEDLPDNPAEPVLTRPGPACARRVGWIFDRPRFYVPKSVHARDIRPGAEEDCWFISSLGSLCVDTEVPRLVENVAPPSCRDEQVGVYGFVFNRDGEWISEVVDDKLYISVPDYDDCVDKRRVAWDASHSQLEPEVSRAMWKETFQSNSDALYFASCAHPQETWVPLMEKAFAKAHGDYEAINGGWPGEGVEDLTGGLTTEIVSADISDRGQLWEQVFLNVNKVFLIGAGTRNFIQPDPSEQCHQGVEDDHAYSVIRAVDYKGHWLVMLKNPWGGIEWTGPWSDGSREWTAQALQDLNYKFGNEGVFWMPYVDFLQRFPQIRRTRLFSPEWNVSQQWTRIQVPWLGDYNPTIFEFTVAAPTRTVIALSHLDSRYFGGLTGRYSYELAFRLHLYGSKEYIIRGHSSGDRSAVTEVDLKPGRYEVLMKVQAFRDSTQPTITDVIKQNWISRRDKLVRTGLSYDTAHTKGQITAPKEDGKTVEAPAKDAPTLLRPKGSPCSNAAEGSSPKPRAQDEPWSAPLVVGLRVFCQNTAATIRVVDPNNQGWWPYKRLNRYTMD